MSSKGSGSNFGWRIFITISFIGFLVILFGLGIKGRYRAGGETTMYLVVCGIVLVLPFIFYALTAMVVQKRAAIKNAKRIDLLIKTGDKITIDLDTLKIEVGLLAHQHHKYKNGNQNVIPINVVYKDHLISTKYTIQMDTTNLKIHFAIKKKTVLYIDPKNPSNNYLDLKFLES